MKLEISLCLYVFLLAVTPALADNPIRPDPILTPGSVYDNVPFAEMCTPGYSKTVRHTSGALKHEVYDEYHIDKTQGHYEIDHLIPLSIGGADEKDNLWPESYDGDPWNAHTKDDLEDYLHREVCSGRIELAQAQNEIATNWIAAYQKYFRDP